MEVDWNVRYVEANTPWDSGVPSQELEKFLAEGLISPCRMLELGCGTGTNAIFLAKHGFDVTGVDLSEEALRQAREKAEKAGVKINFIQADITKMPDMGAPFPFVFDRGTYHICRQVDLKGFQETLSKVVAPYGLYVVLAGNANERDLGDEGPPKVRAHDLCRELEGDEFDLLTLKETQFHGVKIQNRTIEPMAWAAVLKRRGVNANRT